MKIFIFSFLISSFLFADYLYTDRNKCVYDLTPKNNGGWCYTYTQKNKSECNKRAKITQFLDGYNIDSGSCTLKNDLKITGLTQNQWNVSLALLAHFLGFTQLFLTNFLAVLVSRR